MSEKLTDIVKNMLDGMHSISHSETIVGEATKLGEATIVPVHRVRMGFAVGAISGGAHAASADGKTGGRAVGGGAQVDPVAVIAVGPDGRPRLLPVDGDAEGTWQRLVQEAPDLLSRLLHKVTDRLEALAASRSTPERKLETAEAAPAQLAGEAAEKEAAQLPEKASQAR
jgi:uncharacterized spore protein YtfJ